MIGAAIRYYRKEQRGMTLKELAHEVRCHEVTISRYERGERTPSDERIEAIADALDVDVADIHEKARALADDPENGNAPPADRHVTTTDEVSRWRDAVVRDQSLDEWTQMLLMAIPAFLDKVSWVVPVTTEQFLRETGRSEDVVMGHWGDMLESPYVERVGEPEYTLRLVFPEDMEQRDANEALERNTVGGY